MKKREKDTEINVIRIYCDKFKDEIVRETKCLKSDMLKIKIKNIYQENTHDDTTEAD